MYLQDLSPEDRDRYEELIDRIIAFTKAPSPIFIKAKKSERAEEDFFLPMFKGRVNRVQVHEPKREIFVTMATADEDDPDGVEAYVVNPRDFRAVYGWLTATSVNDYYRLKYDADDAMKTLEMKGWDDLEDRSEHLSL